MRGCPWGAPSPAFDDDSRARRHPGATDPCRGRLRSQGVFEPCLGMDNANNNQPERVVTTGAQAAERRQHRATRLGDHESTRAARPVEVTGPDPESAHEWLATYEPTDLDEKTWKAVRGFVVE